MSLRLIFTIVATFRGDCPAVTNVLQHGIESSLAEAAAYLIGGEETQRNKSIDIPASVENHCPENHAVAIDSVSSADRETKELGNNHSKTRKSSRRGRASRKCKADMGDSRVYSPLSLLKVCLFAFLIAADATLRGISQVFLCDNPISGILIFIGLCISTDVHLGPLALVGSFFGLLGGVAATLLAVIGSSSPQLTAVAVANSEKETEADETQQSTSLLSQFMEPPKRYRFAAFSDALHHGLFGYDGSLAASGTKVFLAPLLVRVSHGFGENGNADAMVDLGLVYAVGALLGFFCGAARGGISRGIHRAFGLPTLTLTFNTVILLALYALGGPSGAFVADDGFASGLTVNPTISCCVEAAAICSTAVADNDAQTSGVSSSVTLRLRVPPSSFSSPADGFRHATCAAINSTSSAVIAEGWVLGAAVGGSGSGSVLSYEEEVGRVLSAADPALLDISSRDWAIAVILGVSQFMFVDTLEGGILVLAGIFWSSVVGCALAVAGSTVSLLSATFLIKLSYRKTLTFAEKALFGVNTRNAAGVLASPRRTIDVPLAVASACPRQVAGGPAEFAPICLPLVDSGLLLGGGLPPVSGVNKQYPWTVPVASVKNGLAGYNGGGTMACLGGAVLGRLLHWRKAMWRASRLSKIGFVLAAVAMALYCCTAVTVTSVFFAALPSLLPFGAPVMTLPFVLTTYLFFTPLSA